MISTTKISKPNFQKKSEVVNQLFSGRKELTLEVDKYWITCEKNGEAVELIK